VGYVLDVATNFVSLVIGDRWLVVGSRSWAGNGRIGGARLLQWRVLSMREAHQGYFCVWWRIFLGGGKRLVNGD
jgi:hypothetical protein